MAERFRFPHPLTLLLACILAAAVLSWVLPAGEYERRTDAETGRSVVVSGSFHDVDPAPVGPFDALVAIPRGMAEAADIIFLVFLVGGAFTVVDATGAFRTGLDRLAGVLGRRQLLVIPIACVAFATGGALFNMHEEIIALIPVLLLLTTRLGVSPVIAIAMSVGAAVVGSAFSPINPFQVGIAQQLAELPLLSGAAFRSVFLVLAVAVWIWGTLRFAVRSRDAAVSQATPSPPASGERAGAASAAEGDARSGPAARAADPGAAESRHGTSSTGPDPSGAGSRSARLPPHHAMILALVAVTFAAYVYGVMRLGWGFDEMSALFFLMGILVGLIGGLRVEGTARAYVEGFKAMAFAGLLIGFARGIFVVLSDGRIVDTIVHGLFQPIAGLPGTLAAVGMMGVQMLIHIPVPSMSGQAVLTMPILVPLSDLLDITRQVTILAYQYGAGLMDMLTPTNGALMAIIAAAGVRYDDWLRFALPVWGALMALGAAGLFVAMAIGLS